MTDYNLPPGCSDDDLSRLEPQPAPVRAVMRRFVCDCGRTWLAAEPLRVGDYTCAPGHGCGGWVEPSQQQDGTESVDLECPECFADVPPEPEDSISL